MKKKALWASFFFLCVRASVSRVTISIWLSPRRFFGAKEEGLYLQLHSTHRNQNGESIFVCVDPFFSVPSLLSNIIPVGDQQNRTLNDRESDAIASS